MARSEDQDPEPVSEPAPRVGRLAPLAPIAAKLGARTVRRSDLTSIESARAAALRMLQRVTVPVTRAALTMGQITLSEARLLSELCRSVPEGSTIIEVGTLFGYSTRIIALSKPETASVVTVDSYCWNPLGLRPRAHRRVTADLLEECVRDLHVSVIAGDKDEFYASYDGPAPALIFLDADHDYEPTRKDLEWATSFPDAVICLHDYIERFPGVIRAVDEFGGPDRLVRSLCTLAR
jgi:predicted O-methyltransferase YrrM